MFIFFTASAVAKSEAGKNKGAGKVFFDRLPVFLYGSLALFCLDMATRYACFASNCQSRSAGWLGLMPFRNYDFAFSLKVPVVGMYIVYAVVLCVLVRFIIHNWRMTDAGVNFAWLMVCAGAVANIVDRLYYGYVRDFIRIGNGFINLGDVWITVGALFVCLYPLKKKRL